MGHTFVLVHGAWHGSWCWEAVAGILRGRGHAVTAPCQTGVGERAGELAPDITLETFITDITEHFDRERIADAILVGHSFGGSSISGAAERRAAQVSRLIYLDATFLAPGEAPLSRSPTDVIESRKRLAEETSGGLSLPPPKPEHLGVTDKAQAAWVSACMTPHPMATFLSPLPLEAEPASAHPADYIWVTEPEYRPLVASRERARERGLPMHPLATGHDAMVTAPQALAEMLIGIAEG
ncbi:MAG: alpha/beta fold hydrolase [Pseudomonadota bacterium]